MAAAALLAGCAAAPDAWPKLVQGREMLAFGSIEECRQLKAGERLDYDFKSSEPLQFSIRYREKNAVLMPVSSEHTSAESGRFVALTAQNYCVAWEAGPAGARIDYRLVLRPE